MINSPLYRIEHFLDAWLNGTTPPEPLHPIEFFIAKLCGADVVTPEPISRADKYLAKLLGEDIEIPKPQTRMDFYLAAMCGEDVEIPEPLYRIEYWLAQLANSGELKTVTGNPISVSDALARPAESLVIEILPQQSGSGNPSPDNVRPITGFTGVNIYRESAYDPDADPTYAIDWQDEAGTVYGGSLDVTSGVLTVTKESLLFDSSAWLLSSNFFYKANTVEVGKNVSWYYTTENGIKIYINSTNGQARIYLADNDFLTSESDVGSMLNGYKLLYELATPLTIQLTATQVDMLLGNNTIWNDVGDMTLEYLADGPADDIDALNILLNNRYVNNGEPDEATDKEALEILLGGNTR